jgi:opine dehydrogenase
MTTVAVLGAGAGGLSAAVELTLSGHRVRLWNRSTATLRPFLTAGGIRYTGVLGEGTVRPVTTTTDLAEALRGVDVAVVVLPALAHERLFAELAQLRVGLPVVLNPGHTGGALHLREVFQRRGVAAPPAAELSTLTYVARTVAEEALVRTTGRAGRVRGACLPGGRPAVDAARQLFPGVAPERDVIATSLSNVNLVLHPPGAVLGAAWVEASGGDFRFYVDGMTDGVARVLVELDRERRSVARAFGHDLPSLITEMAAIGTSDADAAARGEVVAAIRGGTANQGIRAPNDLGHRYYQEDLPYGLVPFAALADVAAVPVPTARSLLRLGGLAAGLGAEPQGLDAGRLGLTGLGLDEVLDLVRGRRKTGAA